jgi:hypothetical protein
VIGPEVPIQRAWVELAWRIDMKLPRFSLATIGFTILVLAIDFAVIRVAFQSHSLSDWAPFALLLLPMLDAVLIALYRMRRRKRRAPKALGFLVCGAAATMIVFGLCVIAPGTATSMLRAVGRPIFTATVNGMTRLFGNGAMQHWGMQITVGIAFELLLPMAFFCLPPLFVALLGRSLAPRRFRETPVT